jgi:hypothetical protein
MIAKRWVHKDEHRQKCEERWVQNDERWQMCAERWVQKDERRQMCAKRKMSTDRCTQKDECRKMCTDRCAQKDECRKMSAERWVQKDEHRQTSAETRVQKNECWNQCCGSKAVSTVFGLPDPDPLLFLRILSWLLSSTSKKNFSFTALRLLNKLLSLLTDVNVPSVSKKEKKGKKTYFLLTSWSDWKKRAGSGIQRYGSADPDRCKETLFSWLSFVRYSLFVSKPKPLSDPLFSLSISKTL